jgi:hypothetical protein
MPRLAETLRPADYETNLIVEFDFKFLVTEHRLQPTFAFFD